MKADRYSRTVTWLKVAFPLAALVILSTLFLLSRVIDPTTAIPFADSEVQERLLNQQITGPFFSWTTADGDQISFTAETVATPAGRIGVNRANEMKVVIDQTSGTSITLESSIGSFDLSNDLAELVGDVVITTSQGYEIRSQFLHARMSALDITSPDTVTALTPAGDLRAGSMHLSAKEPNTPAQLIFTNGVKLLYQPKLLKD